MQALEDFEDSNENKDFFIDTILGNSRKFIKNMEKENKSLKMFGIYIRAKIKRISDFC